MEGDFIWPRALRSRANMTVCWDSRAGSASRFLHSGGGRYPILVFSCPPVGLGRGAQPKTDQGSRLSEPKASSSETPFLASTAACLERSGRTQTIASPSLCLLSLGEARESESPAGARPGLLVDLHRASHPTWIPDQVRDDGTGTHLTGFGLVFEPNMPLTLVRKAQAAIKKGADQESTEALQRSPQLLPPALSRLRRSRLVGRPCSMLLAGSGFMRRCSAAASRRRRLSAVSL